MAQERGASGALRGALARACGFEHVEIGERLEGGYANDLFRVVADGRELVLRIKHPPVVEEDIAWEHRVTRRLADRLEIVHAPGDAVRLGDRVGWLMPFVDGDVADDPVPAAAALARLHRVGRELAIEPRPRLRPLRDLEWPPLVVPPELAEWRTTIAEAREWAIAFVAGLPELPVGLIHGDYFPGNVLVRDGQVVAILDWEEAQLDWLTWDVAGAVASFGEAFAAAYADAGGPAPLELVAPLVRVKRILEVLRAPTDRVPRWDHQRENLQRIRTCR